MRPRSVLSRRLLAGAAAVAALAPSARARKNKKKAEILAGLGEDIPANRIAVAVV